MVIPLVVHGVVQLHAKLGTLPALPEVEPSIAEFEKVGGQRIFYVAEYPSSSEPDAPQAIAVVRTVGNKITFDTATDAKFVEVAATVAGRAAPGVHLHLGSGTHGSIGGNTAATVPKLADPSLIQEDLATLAPGKLPDVGPRSVIDVRTPQGQAAFATLEQTAASAPPGTVMSMAAWCYSTTSVR
jgi:hypothetical protein